MTIADIEARFAGPVEMASFAEMEQVVEVYQKRHCEIYRRFGYKYLPVSAFKHTQVATFPVSEAEHVFLSSATGSSGLQSRHYVRRMAIYEASVRTAFGAVFGRTPLTIWAHLPGYVSESSLVCMIRILMKHYGDDRSRFIFGEDDFCVPPSDRPFVLFGVAFGLLNLAETGLWKLPLDTRIVETGGMKTHRRELTRKELHCRLSAGFGIGRDRIWSEYGMCELLSQAYARGCEIYVPPPWMRVRIVDPHEPERGLPDGEPGRIAITDLANMHTVSSILTEDIGVGHGGGFEVLGRSSEPALRGCNFLFDNI